jgi:hypothetical protein
MPIQGDQIDKGVVGTDHLTDELKTKLQSVGALSNIDWVRFDGDGTTKSFKMPWSIADSMEKETMVMRNGLPCIWADKLESADDFNVTTKDGVSYINFFSAPTKKDKIAVRAAKKV